MKKRIISFLLVMALVLSMAPTIELSAIAIPENTDAKMRRSYMEEKWNLGSATTISFSDVSNRTVFTENQQVWEQNGITVINDRAESVQPVQDYADPAHFYANSTLTIETTEMISYIVFDCASELFVGSLLNSGLPGSDMLHCEGKQLGIWPPLADSTYTFELHDQVRLDAITVYYGNSFPVWPSSDEQSVLMGKNHVYVPEENVYTGTKCTFTAIASGTYVLTNFHDSAYIQCGNDLIRGYGSRKEFYLAKGESIQIVAGLYLGYADGVGFSIVMRDADEISTEPEVLESTLIVGNNAFDGENVTYTYTAAENGVLTLRLRGSAVASTGDQLSAEYSINGGQPVELKKDVNTTLKLCRGNVVTIMVETNCSGGLTASWSKTLPDVIAEGTCGENLTWTLDENSLLTISGTGEMTSELSTNYGSYIKAVVIEDGVTSICDKAFYGWDGLTSIVIPESVTRIGDMAFSDCNQLCVITLPEGITDIGDRAFFNCWRLNAITIPSNVVNIGEYAFFACRNLEAIHVDSNNANYCSDDRGVLFNKDKTTLLCVPNALSGSYVIPEGVTHISNYAFDNCTCLISIMLPGGINSIGEYAFANCVSLTGVTIPAGVTNIGQSAFAACISLTGVTIPVGVTNVGDGAFSECDSLWHVLYTGTEGRWNQIAIENNNDKLTGAKRHYLCDGDEITDYGKKMCRICSGQKPAVTECPHDMGYVYEEKAPSCVEEGYARYSCFRCGYNEDELILPATGMHVMPESALVTERYACSNYAASAVVMPVSDVTVTFTALLNSSGSRSYINIQRYDAESGIYKMIAQLYNGDMVQLQLLAGVQYRVYSFANGVLEYSYMGNPVTTIPGNCDTETVSRFTCVVCSQNVEQKLGYVHNLSLDLSVAPTDSTYGYHVYACQDCGAYGMECTEPLGTGTSEPCAEHNWADLAVPGANCQNAGYAVYACLDCGEHGIQVVPQRDHTGRTEEAYLVYPSDGWDGYYYWYCEFCGLYMEETISCEGLETYSCYEDAAAVHDLSDAEGNVFRRGSCTIVGADVYLCNCCQQFIVVEDPTTGFHLMPDGLLDRFDPNNQVEVPNAGEPVIYSGYLTEEEAYGGHYYTFVMPCDGKISITKNGTFYISGVNDYDTYAAGTELSVNIWNNHGEFTYEAILTVIPETKNQEFHGKTATCTEAGYTDQYYCERCGAFCASEVIPALGHSYVSVVTKPTFETGGYTTYTCMICEHSYVGDYTDPLVNIAGDVSADGVLDTDDAIYLLYYTLFGEEMYPINQSCDYDGNGVIDTDDAIYLLYHTLFGDSMYPLN